MSEWLLSTPGDASTGHFMKCIDLGTHVPDSGEPQTQSASEFRLPFTQPALVKSLFCGGSRTAGLQPCLLMGLQSSRDRKAWEGLQLPSDSSGSGQGGAAAMGAGTGLQKSKDKDTPGWHGGAD